MPVCGAWTNDGRAGPLARFHHIVEGSTTPIRTLHLRQLAKILLPLASVLLLGLIGWWTWAGSRLSVTGLLAEDEPHILYIAWQENGRQQLYVAPVEGGSPLQLTPEDQDVIDYALSPDGQTIVYSVGRDDGGSDLWAITPAGNGRRQLLDCAPDACSQPVWSPDGQRLVYERRSSQADGSPHLWWLDLASAKTVPVFEDNQQVAMAARFSPDGRWLSYVSPQTQEIHVYNLDTQRLVRIPSRTGEPAAWGPGGDTLLTTTFQFQGERFSIHIFKTRLEDVTVTNLSGAERQVEDGSPSWSPDGAWIAFGRRARGTPMGKQIWLMRADGSDSFGLTNNPDDHYGPPAWSPDGRSLAVHRYDLTDPEADPGIWLLDVEGQQKRQVAVPGVQPTWLP